MQGAVVISGSVFFVACSIQLRSAGRLTQEISPEKGCHSSVALVHATSAAHHWAAGTSVNINTILKIDVLRNFRSCTGEKWKRKEDEAGKKSAASGSLHGVVSCGSCSRSSRFCFGCSEQCSMRCVSHATSTFAESRSFPTGKFSQLPSRTL